MLKYFLGIISIMVFVLGAVIWWNFFAKRVAVPSASKALGSSQKREEGPVAITILKNMKILWALDFLPDGSLIFTERDGKVFTFDPKKDKQPAIIFSFPDNYAESVKGEGGLLGLALHPQFSENNFVYFYHTYAKEGKLFNRVVRMKKNKDTLQEETILLDNIPGGGNHNGGRIKFGPDGMLYITTGDAGEAKNSQDLKSLAGKILRINDDGSLPKNNPFENSAVYSYGHRNPQGIAWDSEGNLWATEHGPSSGDEINLIVAGKNYGWPIIKAREKAENMETPIFESTPDTWAPAGSAILGNSLFFAGLRGQALYEFDLKTRQLKTHFVGQFGRLRDVVVGPDNFLYILTSTRDGRAIPVSGDDQIIRINPKKLPSL